MEENKTNTNELKAALILNGISIGDFTTMQHWSQSTGYRKINGKIPFTAPEIVRSADYLNLDIFSVNKIFLANEIRIPNDVLYKETYGKENANRDRHIYHRK
jgi:hypothetical protein